MSGGISAIKGFDYQAIVILDRLFDHFDSRGQSASARPEGKDDLDLSWTDNGTEQRQYIQIKKPTEDIAGTLNPTPWSLSLAVGELLPNTIRHLTGNNHTQLWILGDEVDSVVTGLISAGINAPNSATEAYWRALHGLARNDALSQVKRTVAFREKLMRWRVPADLLIDPSQARSRLVAAFQDLANLEGAAPEVLTRYIAKLEDLHNCLPDVLPRIEIQPLYGTELEVAKRVHSRLEQRYGLQREVIENTLFRNLLGFINDISKQPGRKFVHEELEIELRTVWPHMIPIKDAPQLALDHVGRRDLIERFTTQWSGKAIEAVGISGSGKTTLAGAVARASEINDPDRLVYYAEVRPAITLRDVLAGVAFHLRRYKIGEPFSLAVQEGPPDEAVYESLAQAYSRIPCEVLFLIDMVEGTCSTAFSRDLATFIRALSSSACRVAIFGQESTLRELSSLDRNKYGVERLDIPGFTFDEFAGLTSCHHANLDRAKLWDIYHQVTAGRATGLLAKLAQSLALASSVQEMAEIAAKPPEDILAHAEQSRFARISDSARSAAEKLVCFALPFRRHEAEEVFPTDNVGAAIRELVTQGLLCRQAAESFEMHETVRAGLESLVAVGVRRSAHQALAVSYGARGLVTAEIYHMEHAGSVDDAKTRARDVFLQGKHWGALSAYVVRHKLVSAHELVEVMAQDGFIEESYLLLHLLRQLDGASEVDDLLRLITEQPARYFSHYQWASAVTEAILEFDARCLHDLTVLIVEKASSQEQKESAIGLLSVAIMRKGAVVEPRTIDFFNFQSREVKRQLVRILLRAQHRDALGVALRFLASDVEDPDSQRSPALTQWALQIGTKDQVVEFLAAMPPVRTAEMVVWRSALLGPLTKFVWSKRAELRRFCVEIVRDTDEQRVLENAIRVLVFLAEPSLLQICEPLMNRTDSVRALVLLLPALVPSLCDQRQYEIKVLDATDNLQSRLTACSILAALGADMGALYRRLRLLESDPKQLAAWNFWFLTIAVQHPFPDAIPLLEEQLNSPDNKSLPILVPALVKLGELGESSATEMLIRALSHTHPLVRKHAALALSQRRSHTALPALITQYSKESKEELFATIATAIVASGPNSTDELPQAHETPATQLWRCILATRLRDVNVADWLAAIAIDHSKHWQLRRAAIVAAGRLPYEMALERIVPVVMAERSPLAIDQSRNLGCHATMVSILLFGALDLVRFLAKGHQDFVGFVEGIFDANNSDAISPQGLPSGTAAAEWLFNRLIRHGSPANVSAPDQVINELAVPLLQSAVLRSLRLCGRPDLIEEQLAGTDHVWLAMKCLKERARIGASDEEIASRLRTLVSASPCRGEALLDRVIGEWYGARVTRPNSSQPISSRPPTTTASARLSYDDMVGILRGTSPPSNLPASLMLTGAVTSGQFDYLVSLADPANDPERGIETYLPLISFTGNGHVVAQRRMTHLGTADTPRERIRPAIAAANSFGIPVHWQEALMTGYLASIFVPRYLACLGALDSSERFYEHLDRHEQDLMPYLCDVSKSEPVRKYIDRRIIPMLSRYAFAGTDEMFEGLCTLAAQIDDPEIDPVIRGLLVRWQGRFDVRSPLPQHSTNPPLWRGFKRLVEHPQFQAINDWRSHLSTVLQAQVAWYHADEIVRVLERDPRSYVLIESRLFKALNWEHFAQDEIDRLEDAAERLFGQFH